MIEPAARKPQARANIFEFEIRHFLDDLFRREIICQKIQNVADSNPHATEAGAPSALLRIYRNAICQLGHDVSLSTSP